MSLQIVRGRAGSGKSRYIIDAIKKVPQNERVIMLVPDQFSFIAEKQLVGELGGIGLNKREVLTFRRFIHRMVTAKGEYIKPAGKQMLLYKAVENIKGENSIFEKSLSKPGFIDMLSELISEMKRYAIDTDALIKRAETMSEGMLRKKLEAIIAVYNEYYRLMPDNMLDSEDDMNRLAEAILSSNEFADTHIFIDEFSDFLPQYYSVLRALMKKAKSVTVALCLDDEEDRLSVFSPVIKTLYNLRDTAREMGCDILPDIFISRENITPRFKSSELKFLENEWESDKSYTDVPNDISCMVSVDPYNEIEYAAEEILRLVRNEGYRFKDISIVCADLENYNHLIEVLFRAYDIPYFTDRKIAVTDHPVILLVLAVFDVFADGFSYESMFRYLRTGYADITSDEINILENYVLEHGIRGKNIWLGDEVWEDNASRVFDEAMQEKKESEEEAESRIDALRRRVAEPFKGFEKHFDGRKTVREICTALYNFLDKEIGFTAKVQKNIQYFISNGNMDEAEQYAQIWSILVDVLDQTVAVMDDDYCGMERFSELLRTGLSQYEIGIIPSAVDMVSICNAQRSRLADVKALFIMGATYGKFPVLSSKEGILSDNDRRKLKEAGFEFAPDTRMKLYDSQFKVYSAVTKAACKLFVSYSNADTSGEGQNPSQFVMDLKRKFPAMPVFEGAAAGVSISPDGMVAPEPTFWKMLLELAKGGEYETEWQTVRKWYEEREDFKDRMHILDDAKNDRKASLDASRAKRLYENNREYSASRLEVFASCPFRYFLNYGLRAREQYTWEVQAFDIGSLMHYILKRFCERVEENKKDNTCAEIKKAWRSLDEEKREEIIGGLIEEAREIILKKSIRSKGRIQFLLEQIENTLRDSVKLIAESINGGEFAPIASEKNFRGFKITSVKDEDCSVMLRGQIDRIDMVRLDDKVYLQIVDYKSGSKSFSPTDIYNNFGMQLVIYALAAVELYRQGELTEDNSVPVKIAGILYSSLRDEIVKLKTAPDSAMEKSFRYDGQLLADEEALRCMDREYAEYLSNMADAKAKDKTSFESKYYPFSTTKSVQLSSKSSAESEASFEIMNNYVREAITGIDRKIQEGVIDIYPYSENGNRCAYCPYGEVCRFDRSKHNVRNKKKPDDVWAAMKSVTEKEAE